MPVPKNAMEIFYELDKSNCKLCGEKTCLAFAGNVFTGKAKLSQCPKLTPEQREKFTDDSDSVATDELQKHLDTLIEKAVNLDFEEAAVRVGGESSDDVLRFNVMGKPFAIDKQGKFITDLHVIPWVLVPLLEYVCFCQGRPITGEWISYREIPGGREKYGLFKKRGEDVLSHLGDSYPDFFNDVVHMFDGQEVEKQFESDISVVLHPFPLVPLMICYWKPEEGMDSKLNLFFDSSVGGNLGADQLFYVGTGLAQMFEKLAIHHGF